MVDRKTNKILVNVILDRSGSMGSNRTGTISGYNEYINGLRADKDSDYRVTLIQFDAPLTSAELTVSYENRALADIADLTEAGYEPRGNTPLYDAIGECVRRVDAQDRAVIVLIITDGMENASTEFTRDQVKKLLKDKEAEGWTISFLGANIDSYAVGAGVGVAASYTSNYAQGNEQELFRNLAYSTVNRAHTYGTSGVKAAMSMSFFSDEQRAAMEKPFTVTSTGGLSGSHIYSPSTTTGGRPAAPPPFRKPKPKAKQRDWKVTR